MLNKKLLALAILPLFAACVVNDSDDDGAGTDTDNPTTTASTTMSTTDSTTMSTTDSTTMSTTDSTTMSTTDTDTADTSATETDTDTTDTDTGGGGGFCQFTCEAPEDCCSDADPNCIPGLGTYPYDYGCEDGICTFGGCTEDAQCTFGGVLMGYICDEPTGICGFECADDAECQAQIGMETFTCNGTYCEAPAVAGCESDADCGMLTCNLDTGACECADDTQCGEGQACAGL